MDDISSKLIPKKQRKSMNDPFLERTKKTQNKKEKKESGMVETRNQKAPKDKKAMFEVAIYPNPALDESWAARGTEGNWNRWLTSESTPV